MSDPNDTPPPDRRTAAQLGEAVRASAQQIWLAGLGAFAKAQEEGGKVFDALVREGSGLQSKTQNTAQERFTEATDRMAGVASELSAKAAGGWDKLESIFEERVAKALRKLGVPSAAEIEQLNARIEELDRQLHKLSAARPARKSAAAPPTAAPARGKRGANAKTASRPAARKRGGTPPGLT